MWREALPGDWDPWSKPFWTKRKKKVLVAGKGSFLPGARLAVTEF